MSDPRSDGVSSRTGTGTSARTGTDLPRLVALLLGAAIGGWLGGLAHPSWGAALGGVYGGLLGLAAVAISRRRWGIVLRSTLVLLLLLGGLFLLWAAVGFASATLGLMGGARG